MATPATGELRKLASGYEARIRIEGKVRKGFALVAVGDNEDAARARCQAMAAMAVRLRRAGHAPEAVKLLEMAARARDGRPWQAVEAAVEALCSGGAAPIGSAAAPTMREHLDDWTSGRLAKKYPHHVKAKKSAGTDECRALKHIVPHIGDVRVDAVTLDDCELVMAHVESDGSRRQVAQILSKALALAAYPCRYRKDSPIPKGWLPRATTKKAKECLYPDEDALLLACRDVPLLRRLAYGFFAREGMREGELAALQWRDVDLVRGRIDLDTNKTDEPRSWDLDPSVLDALRRWRQGFAKDAEGTDRVFALDGVPLNVSRLAEQLRDDLRAAGVKREKLFEKSANRIAMRVHDLRATFVTVALANGKTETWVADRTGHTTSAMINRYRRKARTWAGQKLGSLVPLVDAIPELSATAPCSAPYLVGQPGLEPETNGLRGHADAAENTAPRENKPCDVPRRPGLARHGADVGHSMGQADPVEAALARTLEALAGALAGASSTAERTAIARELGDVARVLDERRRARAGVVELRGRGKKLT